LEDLDLYTMAADGSDRRLVWAGDSLQSSVDWLPDGESLVIDAFAADGTLQVFTIPVSGNGPAVQLTHGMPNGKRTWLPDGSGLLYLCCATANSRRSTPWPSTDRIPST
jgi:Tol biopolymer transport system component